MMALTLQLAVAGVLDDFKIAKSTNKHLGVNDYLTQRVDDLYATLMKDPKGIDAMSKKTAINELIEIRSIFFGVSPFKTGKKASDATQKKMFRSLFQMGQLSKEFGVFAVQDQTFSKIAAMGSETPIGKHQNITFLFMMMAHACAHTYEGLDISLTDATEFTNHIKNVKAGLASDFVDDNQGPFQHSSKKFQKAFGFWLIKNHRDSFNRFWKENSETEAYIQKLYKYLKDFQEDKVLSKAEHLIPKKATQDEEDPSDYIQITLNKQQADGKTALEKIEHWKVNPQGFLDKVNSDLTKIPNEADFSEREGLKYSVHETIKNFAHYLYALLSRHDGKYLWDYLGQAASKGGDVDYPLSMIKEKLNKYKDVHEELKSTIEFPTDEINSRKVRIKGDFMKGIHGAGLEKAKKELETYYKETTFELIAKSYMFAEAIGELNAFLKGFPKQLLCTAALPTDIWNSALNLAKRKIALKKGISALELVTESFEDECKNQALQHNSFIYDRIDNIISKWVLQNILKNAPSYEFDTKDVGHKNLEDVIKIASKKKNKNQWQLLSKQFSDDVYRLIKETFEKDVLSTIHKEGNLIVKPHDAQGFWETGYKYEKEHADLIFVYYKESKWVDGSFDATKGWVHGHFEEKLKVKKICANQPINAATYLDNQNYGENNNYTLNNIIPNNDVLQMYFKERFLDKLPNDPVHHGGHHAW